MLSVGVNNIISPGDGSLLIKNPVRVLGIKVGLVIVIELSTTPRKPWIIDRHALENEIAAGASVITLERPMMFMLRSEEELSEADKASRDKNWSLVSELVEGKQVFDILSSNFGATVASHAKKMGVDRKMIYKLLYRYWSMGQSCNAFLRNTIACGGRGKTKNRKNGVVLGRPPKYRGVVVENGAVALEEHHLTAIYAAYRRHATGKCGSYRDCHTWMLNTFFSETNADGTKGDVIRGSYPTLEQLKYQGKKFFDNLYSLKGRRGTIRYNKDFRPIIGDSVQGLAGPCHRYEIDSTIADIYLVHRVNRNWLIGRPVLYVVVDTYTRMIVGIHVGLEGPSWNGARHAIFNAYTPKKEFCDRYNIAIEESDWPCSHLPIELVADRAELLSEAGETMAKVLGTIVKILPPFRPDWKSIIESRFRLINEKLDLKFVPGGVDARRLERGDRDYQLDAVLDIDEFTQMIIHGVLAHNKTLRLPHLLTRDMIAEDLEPTPINIWKWSLARSHINAKHVSPSELKIALLPSRECRILRSGISFSGILYTCETAVRNNWFSNSYNFKTQYVRLFYDPNCVDNCWIKTENGFELLTIVPQQEKKYRGMRMEEALDIVKIVKQMSPDVKYMNDNSSAKLKKIQDDIINSASEKKYRQSQPISKAEFKRDKLGKRAVEAQTDRDRHTAELSKIRDGEVTPLVTEGSSAAQDTRSARSAAFLKLVVNETNGVQK